MESELITYQKFDDIALANELIDILSENGIEYTMEEQNPVFDPSFSFKELLTEYAVKIKAEDFERVNKLLLESEDVAVDAVDKDYYLFSFSNDELMDVITKADEWSSFDSQLARKILAEKGIDISDQKLADINKQRLEELAVPDPPQTTWIIIGYITAFLGGLIGLFIGWHLSTYKKTLPNGDKVYGYTPHDRKHGNRIFFISIVMICISVILKAISAYKYGD